MSPAKDALSPNIAKGFPVILVVEDEVLVRLDVAEFLREHDLTVIEAVSADEARAVLASGFDVDLVFSDIQMPGEMDGVGLAQWLATHHPEIPVVLTSGAPYAIPLATAACAAVKSVLSKPYDREQLVARFKELLKLRARLS